MFFFAKWSVEDVRKVRQRIIYSRCRFGLVRSIKTQKKTVRGATVTEIREMLNKQNNLIINFYHIIRFCNMFL